MSIQMKYTSNFKPSLLLQPALFKSATNVPLLSKKNSSKNNLTRHLTKYIKYEDSSFKATSMCFIYTTFKTLVHLNDLYKKKPLTSDSNQVLIKNLSFFSIKTKTSRHTILRAPYRYKKGRYQVGFKRYSVMCSFDLHVDQHYNSNSKSLMLPIELNKVLLLSLKNVSSNTLNLNKMRIISPIKCPNFFKVISYKK